MAHELLLPKLKRHDDTMKLAVIKNQIAQNSLEYDECMEGVKGSPYEKRLAIQIIAKFYKYFPRLQEKALNCILDLCEDAEAQTRMFAIKFLPAICKAKMEDTVNIAYTLSQLLQLRLPDYNVVCDSLAHVFKLDPLAALKGTFKNVDEMEEGPARDLTVEFAYNKLIKLLAPDVQRKVDAFLLSEAKNRIRDCSTEEFMTYMTFMVDTKWAKSHTGRQEVFQIIEQTIQIDKLFYLEDVDRLAICVDLIVPLFGDASSFVKFYCQKVLPKFPQILTIENGDQFQIKLLRQLVCMSPHCKQVAPEALDSLLESLKEFIPKPPENLLFSQGPALELCHIECLLYSFHNLCKTCPEFWLNDQDKLSDFRTRLQYLSMVVSDFDQGLKRQKQNDSLNLSQVDRIRLDLAPHVFRNLLEIGKDFFHQPPLYATSVQLSYTLVRSTIKVKDETTFSSPKRRSPITYSSDDGASDKSQQEFVGKSNPPPLFSGGFGGRGRGNRSYNRSAARGRIPVWENSN